MERLTIIDGCGNDELARCMNCGLEKAGENLENCGMCEEGWQRALRRLAAYEDTGLEPEDIVGLKNTCDQLHGINDSLFNANQAMGKYLAEWKKAHEDGRLVVLPCKVGQPIYYVDLDCKGRECPKYYNAEGCHPFCDCGKRKVHEVKFALVHAELIGKGFYLTRKEAEAAMAGKDITPSDAQEEPAEPEWKARFMRTFLGGR